MHGSCDLVLGGQILRISSSVALPLADPIGCGQLVRSYDRYAWLLPFPMPSSRGTRSHICHMHVMCRRHACEGEGNSHCESRSCSRDLAVARWRSSNLISIPILSHLMLALLFGLMHACIVLFHGRISTPAPLLRVRACAGRGLFLPIWLLGSSTRWMPLCMEGPAGVKRGSCCFSWYLIIS
jgi:hypothetical protein